MKLKSLFAILLITLGAGGIAGLLTADSMQKYQEIYHPPLSPPGWVFPIAWTILYVLMAVAAYLVYTTEPKKGQGGESADLRREKREAGKLYFAQLFVNVVWPLLFFGLDAYLLAAVWILLLWYLIFLTTEKFYPINQTAGKLMIPYLVWVTYAAYLNIAIAVYTYF